MRYKNRTYDIFGIVIAVKVTSFKIFVMITAIIITFIVYKLLGKNNPFRKATVKAPVCEQHNEGQHIGKNI